MCEQQKLTNFEKILEINKLPIITKGVPNVTCHWKIWKLINLLRIERGWGLLHMSIKSKSCVQSMLDCLIKIYCRVIIHESVLNQKDYRELFLWLQPTQLWDLCGGNIWSWRVTQICQVIKWFLYIFECPVFGRSLYF